MALPAPAPGLVICYSYLWHDEKVTGAVEGRKDRPCAIVVATTDANGDTIVYVVPVTHRRPADPHAVQLPTAVKRKLRLDAESSWIVTSELNQFVWPGFDLRPISRKQRDQFTWGFLPKEILAAVKRGIAANRKEGRINVSRR
jgi:hypothetical protein